MEIMKSPPDTDDTASDGLGSSDLVFAEGMLIDDHGTLIKTCAVRLGSALGSRDAVSRTPPDRDRLAPIG